MSDAIRRTSGVLNRRLHDLRWFQLLLGVFTSTVLPSLLVWLIWPDQFLTSSAVRNSAVAGFLAFFIGLVWYRRMVQHPGVRGLENVLTVFIVTYVVASAILLLARLDYNRTYLFTSFACSLIAFTLVALRAEGRVMPVFHVVPVGAYQRMLQTRRADFIIMTAPKVPPPNSGSIVADLRADLPDEWERMIADAVLAGTPVFHVKQIEEAISGQVDIEHLSENQFGSLLPSLGFRKIKSICDIAAALILFPFLLIPFAIVAALIKIDSPGPIFFHQTRIGFGGKPFRVFKFRTMYDNSGLTDDDLRAAAMTVAGDARITRLGGVLRRFRIDELSQIVNVLRGEMSWIGPRPEALELSNWYAAELPFYQYRHIVAPGVTGWAQVNQGHVTELGDAHDKLRYDFYYIKNFSIWLDLLILVRTIRIVTHGFGAK